jgi:LacI family transcriptional regulator
MNTFALILSADVRDSRIHEGVARYVHASAAITDLMLTDRLPWDRIYRGENWPGALIQVGPLRQHKQVRKELRSISYPVVLLSPVSHCRCPQVLEDNYEAGRLAAEYFLHRKFRHFAVAGQGIEAGYLDRVRGFENALAPRGFPVRHIIYHEYTHHDRSPAPKLGWGPYLLQSIREAEKPLAILALDDKIGISVLRHCTSAAIRIPQEVVVLGVGNERILCDYASPPLSSIDMNLEQLGWTATQLLHRLMEGGRPPETPVVITPLGIVERRSTEILGADNPLAMNALRYLWDHLAKPAMPADVARSVGISRPYLDRLFLASFGRTVKQEQTRVRMQRVREMLTTTNMPAKQIATAAGFRTLAHMSRVFLQENKVTPRQFRLRLATKEADPWELTRNTARLVPGPGGPEAAHNRKPARRRKARQPKRH